MGKISPFYILCRQYRIPFSEVARECGFPSGKYMSTKMQRRTLSVEEKSKILDFMVRRGVPYRIVFTSMA